MSHPGRRRHGGHRHGGSKHAGNKHGKHGHHGRRRGRGRGRGRGGRSHYGSKPDSACAQSNSNAIVNEAPIMSIQRQMNNDNVNLNQNEVNIFPVKSEVKVEPNEEQIIVNNANSNNNDNNDAKDVNEDSGINDHNNAFKEWFYGNNTLLHLIHYFVQNNQLLVLINGYQ